MRLSILEFAQKYTKKGGKMFKKKKLQDDFREMRIKGKEK